MTSKLPPKKQTKKELRRKLSRLKSTGIYQPRSTEITDYRKRKINALYKQFQKQLETDEFVFAKFPPKTEKKLKAKAKALNLPVTSTGVFVGKDGQRKAKIQFNRQLQEYEIALTGKAKYGKRAGTKITSYLPLASVDTIEKEMQRLEGEANTHNLKSNEYLRIRVTETGNDGFSEKIFKDFSALSNYLEGYKKSKSQRIAFYRYLTIEKVTIAQHNIDKSNRSTKKRKVNRTGRN